MKYVSLRKLYYKSRAEYESVYEERFLHGKHLGINVGDSQAFFIEDVESYKTIGSIYKVNGELIELVNSLPGIAKSHYTNRCLIDEIMLTNDIEGVRSTRKEVSEILRDLGKRNKRNRFFGLVNEYAALQSNAEANLQDCSGIREIYDILFLDEVKSEDPEDIPDGKIFRAGPVSVMKPTQQPIHKGVEPEDKIIEYMEKSLEVLADDDIDILIRISIFHYLFGYIHPFYEANGRMSRFISSYILSKELVYLTGYRLSYYLKEHISEYYRAFEECNDKRNRGDVTPFINMFLSVILGACTQLRDELALLNNELIKYRESISDHYEDSNMQDLLYYLIQAALFSDIGISIDELLGLTNVTRATLRKRLLKIENDDLLIENRQGTKKFYVADLDKLDLLV